MVDDSCYLCLLSTWIRITWIENKRYTCICMYIMYSEVTHIWSHQQLFIELSILALTTLLETLYLYRWIGQLSDARLEKLSYLVPFNLSYWNKCKLYGMTHKCSVFRVRISCASHGCCLKPWPKVYTSLSKIGSSCHTHYPLSYTIWVSVKHL